MNIAFIGYGNHAKRIHSILDHEIIDKIICYHPNKIEEGTTNKLSHVYDCDAVFVTSPNLTHFEYINLLINNSECFIFCEKPPVSTIQQLLKIKDFAECQKKRIYFNFNFRFSKISEIISNFSDKSFGDLINLNLSISHGLAHKNSYKNTWRGGYEKSKSSVLDTLLIHLIDIVNYNSPESDDLKLISCNSSSFAYGNDSCSLLIRNKFGATFNLFASYAAPYQLAMNATGTNGLVNINRNTYFLYSPRDTFDNDGLFTDPPNEVTADYKFEQDYQDSLRRSVYYFISCVENRLNISKNHFMTSMKTAELLFDAEDLMNRNN